LKSSQSRVQLSVVARSRALTATPPRYHVLVPTLVISMKFSKRPPSDAARVKIVGPVGIEYFPWLFLPFGRKAMARATASGLNHVPDAKSVACPNARQKAMETNSYK